MKATLEHVVVESLAEFGLPQVDVKFTAAEWQLMRKFVRMAREHMETLETDLQQEERLVYKQMLPIFVEIDDQVAKSLENIHKEHEHVNMNAVKDFHRWDFSEELAKNVATDEEMAAMRKEEEEAEAAAQAAAQGQLPVPPTTP